jgi:hypothetical protein
MKPSVPNEDGSANTERRKHPRFVIQADYLLLLNGVEHKGMVMNISLGGAYLATITPTVTEDNLFQDGEITLAANNASLNICCHITYVGTEQNEFPKGVGIAFANNNEMNTGLITEFMEALNVVIPTIN